MEYSFGIIGSGSWATALVKILTDNGQKLHWWIRNAPVIEQIKKRRHNPHYLSSAYFDLSLLTMSDNINAVVEQSDVQVLAVPSAFVKNVFSDVLPAALQNKKIVSAIKGLVPDQDLLLNEYFSKEFQFPIEKKNDESRSKKLHSVIKPFILRRHKSQVATELPEKVENVQYCAMSPEQEKRYEEVKTHYREKIFKLIDQEGLGNSRFMILEGLTKLRQLANHPKMVEQGYTGDSGKLEDVTYMLENAIAEGHKVLIFSQFVKHLDLIRQYLKTSKIDFAYLDGSSMDRKEQVERFNRESNLKVFLISIKAGGLGLNLTEADYVFILDPWWNPAVEAQAVDRAHRIGQKRKVFTYKFITRNSVEEKILMLQQRKLKLTTELITTEESFMKQLTRDDISQILL